MSTPTPFVKCYCLHCGGAIEFEAVHAGQEVICPHCATSTWVDLPDRFSYSKSKPIDPAPGIPPAAPPPPNRPIKASRTQLNWFFGLAIGILALGNVLFIYTTLHWRTEYQKSSVQNDRLRTALKMEEDSNAEFKHNVQAAIDTQTIAGLYEWQNAFHRYEEIDLRSDGTGLFDAGNGGTVAKITWQQLTPEKIYLDRLGQWRIENGDLIDEKGNRWLHIR